MVSRAPTHPQTYERSGIFLTDAFHGCCCIALCRLPAYLLIASLAFFFFRPSPALPSASPVLQGLLPLVSGFRPAFDTAHPGVPRGWPGVSAEATAGPHWPARTRAGRDRRRVCVARFGFAGWAAAVPDPAMRLLPSARGEGFGLRGPHKRAGGARCHSRAARPWVIMPSLPAALTALLPSFPAPPARLQHHELRRHPDR